MKFLLRSDVTLYKMLTHFPVVKGCIEACEWYLKIKEDF